MSYVKWVYEFTPAGQTVLVDAAIQVFNNDTGHVQSVTYDGQGFTISQRVEGTARIDFGISGISDIENCKNIQNSQFVKYVYI